VSVEVIHAITGRMRLRVPSLKGNEELSRRLHERLSAVPGITRVEANPVTASVLVLHHAGDAHGPELVQALAEGLAPLAGVDKQRLQARLAQDARRQRPRPLLHRDSVHGFFKGLNASVKSATGGADLSLLVPASLILLGLRRLLLSEGGWHAPRWYDFMWFGFATYLMLNNPAMAKELEPAMEAGLAEL
jgi:hypothetical protein